MTTVIDCPIGAERDVASLYLAGKLGEEEALAFEEHFFGCESCRLDVQRGSELRAAFGKAPIVPAVRPTRSARTWLPLAAAAAIAFVGIGVWQLSRRSAEEPGRTVTRSSAAEVIVLKIEAGPQGGVELTWPSRADAATYRVQIFTADEVSVWKNETKVTRLSIGPGVLPTPAAGQSYKVEVQALDSMGQVVATSEETPLLTP